MNVANVSRKKYKISEGYSKNHFFEICILLQNILTKSLKMLSINYYTEEMNDEKKYYAI